jgi:hypothetical protein
MNKQIYVDEDLWQKFRVKCLKDGRKIKSIIEKMITQYVEGKAKL